jgi:hypothetical protein
VLIDIPQQIEWSVTLQINRRKAAAAAAAVAGMIDGSKIQLQRIVEYAEGGHKGSNLNPRRSHTMS